MRRISDRIRQAAEDARDRHPRTGAAGTLVVRTVKSVIRVRVLGLAAESAFFTLLSLPALLLGLLGTLGYYSSVLGADTVLEIRVWILDLAARVLTSETVDSLVAPLVDDFLGGVQGGIISLTFLVSLWSGSRAMSVFIESITIAYGLADVRGYIHHRGLAFLAYLGGLLFALLVLPVLVAGPDLIRRLLPFLDEPLRLAYWPAVGILLLVCIVTLYTVSVPVRTPLWRHLPGGILAMLILLLGSVGLRVYLDVSFGQVSIYGSLAAPIAIMAWLYVMALAILIGSSLNAEIDAMWPTPTTAEARAEIAARRHAWAVRNVRYREEALQSLAESTEAKKGNNGNDDTPGETVTDGAPPVDTGAVGREDAPDRPVPDDVAACPAPAVPVARPAGESATIASRTTEDH
ncbi:YihY/virulence factor BrkB family protein [Nocardiopsis ansamitocini]|uniref:Membrane protein n=1 Tax=Nocardiopsis ansamitocini TaxID=1670832 RepID=A0A9W6P8E3_9ACTN|nr:YihY/virulence factor BrkB family protein [Nocardiopsis ansamitocini]GLU48954.1 membrane protein [Nocardiopsis ansamitocini]